MGEINFRAWDDKTKTMSYPFTLFSPDIQIYRGWRLMQDTGLKDKNDTRIYEGDIIRVYFSRDRDDFAIREVHSADPMRGMTIKICDTKGNATYFNELHHSQDMEVVGDIYQNPELLIRK